MVDDEVDVVTADHQCISFRLNWKGSYENTPRCPLMHKENSRFCMQHWEATREAYHAYKSVEAEYLALKNDPLPSILPKKLARYQRLYALVSDSIERRNKFLETWVYETDDGHQSYTEFLTAQAMQIFKRLGEVTAEVEKEEERRSVEREETNKIRAREAEQQNRLQEEKLKKLREIAEREEAVRKHKRAEEEKRLVRAKRSRNRPRSVREPTSSRPDPTSDNDIAGYLEQLSIQNAPNEKDRNDTEWKSNQERFDKSFVNTERKALITRISNVATNMTLLLLADINDDDHVWRNFYVIYSCLFRFPYLDEPEPGVEDMIQAMADLMANICRVIFVDIKVLRKPSTTFTELGLLPAVVDIYKDAVLRTVSLSDLTEELPRLEHAYQIMRHMLDTKVYRSITRLGLYRRAILLQHKANHVSNKDNRMYEFVVRRYEEARRRLKQPNIQFRDLISYTPLFNRNATCIRVSKRHKEARRQ